VILGLAAMIVAAAGEPCRHHFFLGWMFLISGNWPACSWTFLGAARWPGLLVVADFGRALAVGAGLNPPGPADTGHADPHHRGRRLISWPEGVTTIMYALEASPRAVRKRWSWAGVRWD